jgi:hypothetical protein
MFIVMLVLDDNDHLDQVLDAWIAEGIKGATIIESSGLFRRRIPSVYMRYTYGDNQTLEQENTTLFSIVEKEEDITKCLNSVEKIVGDLNKPNTGVFCAWPLYIAKGLHKSDGGKE